MKNKETVLNDRDKMVINTNLGICTDSHGKGCEDKPESTLQNEND